MQTRESSTATKDTKPGRMAIGCVTENNLKYLSQAFRLLQSLRWFGGSCAGANFFVCAVDGMDESYRAAFERMGAFVRVVKRFSSKHGPSNKLRFLELPELSVYDTVILMDCDTVIVQDPLKFIDGTVFQAKMADLPTVSHDLMEKVYSGFNLDMPDKDYKCNPSGVPTVWYCNAGVLVFPQEILRKLAPIWSKYNSALLERFDSLGAQAFYCDQISLSLAFNSIKVSFSELPLSMNYPVHLHKLPENESLSMCDPVVIHYHNRVDTEGNLTASPYAGVQRRIEQFNKRLSEERSLHFDNRSFWNARYASDPDLGSGVGSRGITASYKQEVLQSVVSLCAPTSVLDVGCGDQYVSSCVPDEIYTGVDISSVVIERNRAEFANRRFVEGNILDIDIPKSDMVICLDVLIHIDNRQSYENIVRRLVALTGKLSLISGFESHPGIPLNKGTKDGKVAPVFFYEPINETLRKAGVKNLKKAGAYNKVTLWMFEPPDAVSVSPVPDIMKNFRPVFVAGCMRSGTTLFADLLGRFEGVVHCPFELKHIWSLAGVQMASAKTRENICPNLEADDVQEGQAERLKDLFFAEMAKKSPMRKEGEIFLNKNPHFCNKLPFINKLYPDALFIWIYRHMPQVVASLKALFEDVNRRQETWHYWPEPKQGVITRCWEAFHFNPPPKELDQARCFPGGDVKYLAEYWLEANLAVMNFFKGLPAYRKLEVQEEMLLNDPGTQMARCLGFMGLPLTVSLSDDFGIDSSRVNLWSIRLTSQELELLNEFVESNKGMIERLFSGLNYSELYKKQITVLLKK